MYQNQMIHVIIGFKHDVSCIVRSESLRGHEVRASCTDWSSWPPSWLRSHNARYIMLKSLINEHTTKCSCFYHTCYLKMQNVYSFMWWNMCLVSFESWELILQSLSSGLMKLDETIGYCWCPTVMKWSLWLQQWSLWLHYCDVIQSCVTMAVDP